jgi:hypothetical protein
MSSVFTPLMISPASILRSRARPILEDPARPMPML